MMGGAEHLFWPARARACERRCPASCLFAVACRRPVLTSCLCYEKRTQLNNPWAQRHAVHISIWLCARARGTKVW